MTDLDSLEKLLSGATPFVWKGDREGWLAYDDGNGFVPMGKLDEGGDAALCAALRNQAPALLNEIKTLRAWRKEAEGLLREARDAEHCNDHICGVRFGGYCELVVAKRRIDAFLGEGTKDHEKE